MNVEEARQRSKTGLYRKYKRLGKEAIKKATDAGEFNCTVPYPANDYKTNRDAVFSVVKKLDEYYTRKGFHVGMTSAGTPHDDKYIFWEIKTKLED